MKIILFIIFGFSLFKTWKNVKLRYEYDLNEANRAVNDYYTWHGENLFSLITDKSVAQLRQLYAINPKKFQVRTYGIIYNNKILFFFSSMWEWFKFLLWKKELKEQKEDQAKRDKILSENQILKEMYEDLLSDIEEQKQKTKEMIQQGANGVVKVLDRISKDRV